MASTVTVKVKQQRKSTYQFTQLLSYRHSVVMFQITMTTCTDHFIHFRGNFKPYDFLYSPDQFHFWHYFNLIYFIKFQTNSYHFSFGDKKNDFLKYWSTLSNPFKNSRYNGFLTIVRKLIDCSREQVCFTWFVRGLRAVTELGKICILSHFVAELFIHLFIHSIIHSFILSIIRSFIPSLNQSLTHSLTHSLIHSFVVHSFVRFFSLFIHFPIHFLISVSSDLQLCHILTKGTRTIW